MRQHGMGEGSRRGWTLLQGRRDPSPSHAASRRGPLPLPQGERGLGALLAMVLGAFALFLAVPAFAQANVEGAASSAEPAKLTFPPLTGRVVDDAHVLPTDMQAQLTAELAALQQKTGDQLVVVTVPSLQGRAIEDYGYQLGRAWGIGVKGKDNGALLLVAPGEKKVRIEVGYGLEPVLTDALSSVILNTQVLPRFRDNDIPAGVKAGTDAIVHELGLDPAAAQAADQQAAQVQAQGEDQPHSRGRSGAGAFFACMILFFVVSAFFRGGRRGGGMGWMLPLMFMGSGFGRGRDDDWGGGGGFGGGGGGGFSGGGGSFGGGGASGGW